VNDSIKSVDDKLTKIISYNDEKQLDRLEKSYKEQQQRIL